MHDRTSDAYQLLGLARRAGKVATGTDAVRDSVRAGRAKLIVWASDASETQLKKIRSTIHDRTIPQLRLGDRSALGASVGSAPLTAIAVTDPSLAERLLRGPDAEGPGRRPNEPETRR